MIYCKKEKCRKPMYHPSSNGLCPDCNGELLDEALAKQEAAQLKRVADALCPFCNQSLSNHKVMCWGKWLFKAARR
jgi:hypothetical protein